LFQIKQGAQTAIHLPLVDSSAQTVPAPTGNVNTQTAPALPLADLGTQTDGMLFCDSDTQTAPTLPMVDRTTQTSHQNLMIDIIEREWEVQLDRRAFYLDHGSDAAANEITDVDLPRLDDLYQVLLKDKEKATKHKWRRKTVRVFSEIYDDFYY
jgi:hypothetical protein